MILIEETTVPDAALPVSQFRAHLRLGTGFGEETLQDTVLQSFLRAAIAAIEARTGKVLIARDFGWTLHWWQNDRSQPLPVAPVRAIASVTRVDASGAETVVEPAEYRLEQDGDRPRLRPTRAQLPAVPRAGSVHVAMTAGMAPDWCGLPADLGQAVLLLAAHYYEYRNETALSDGCMPFGVTSLIQRYRPMRVGLGAVT